MSDDASGTPPMPPPGPPGPFSGTHYPTEEEKVWHARYCWNCRKRRRDCQCIFP